MAKFIRSAFNSQQWINDQVTEFCFIGRSNVGKSTLINALAKSPIAKTSKSAGKTRSVNFYDFSPFRLVDLPGYGYANLGIEKKEEISEIISDYIFQRTNLFAVFLIIDVNVLSPLDLQMYRLISKKFANLTIVVNKIDKITKNEVKNQVKKIINFFGVNQEQLLLISGKKGQGIAEIWKILTKNHRLIK